MAAQTTPGKMAGKRHVFLSLAFPPAGLWLLWRDPRLHPGRKISLTVILCLYSLLYVTLIVLLLMRFAGLEIEWRGGFPPVLTFQKTKPDYSAVERDRLAQANQPSRLATATNYPPPYWTDFRGPLRDGRYTERPTNTNWPATGLAPRWRQPVGAGYASFTSAHGLAFTIEQRRNLETVAAYDLDTGREVWTHHYEAFFGESMGGEGPRATPTWRDGRLYSLGAQGDLKCLDARTGRVVWETNILTEAGSENLNYGTAASPLIVDDMVIVLPGHSVVAYHKLTGARLWRTLSDQAAYVSPMLVSLAGQRQLLIVTAIRAVGLRVEDGGLLWEFPWRVQYGNSIAQPVLIGTNRFVLSAGYGTGCAAVEVNRTDAGFAARELWRNKNLKNKFASSVLHEGFIYGLDEDMLTCLDAVTGERQWKEGRYDYGQLLLANGHLIILSGSGELALVRATPVRRVELARFPVLKGKTWNHPALAAGRLLVRNAVEMACFDLNP